MYKIHKFLLILSCLLLAKPLLDAQDNSVSYLENAGWQASLFRGKSPSQYLYQHNGTYYFESEAFKTGDIYYNGKVYPGILLNLDACAMEVLARYSKEMSPVSLNTEQVAWFTMGTSLFVNLRYMGYSQAPEGFFEVLGDGDVTVLRYVRKVLKRSVGNHNGKPIGYIDENYDTENPAYFFLDEKHFILDGDSLIKVSRKKASRQITTSKNFGASIKEKASVWKGTDAPAHIAPETIRLGGIGLPDGYFASQSNATAEESTSITASYKNKLYIIGSGEGKGRVSVKGKVTDLESGEPLPGVVIFDDKTSTYARSEKDGSYTISLPGGKNTLHFVTDSKEDVVLQVELRGDGGLNVEMPEKVNLLKASVVSATSMENHRKTAMGVESVSIKTMSKIPSAFGEGDIIKAVLTLPGVKTVGEASGGFNVRGGSQDQNLILFNGNTIYNPSHLFGIFSAFNPDITESVELYKSSIPAQYGGRISSVLTVKSKEGSQEKLKGSAGIGLLTSRLHLEGPIVNKNTTFIMGARVSYSDWLLDKLPKDSNYSGGSAGFGDVNLGVTHRFNAKNSLQFSSYFATDRFSFSGDTTFRYTNVNASLMYRHKDDDGGYWQTSTGYDHYFNRKGIHSWAGGAFDLDTYIRQGFLRSLRVKPVGNHSVSYGLDALLYCLDPGIMKPFGSESEIKARSLDKEWALEPAVFVSDNWQITGQLSAEGGIRLSSFLLLNPSKFYAGPEFRFSARYSPLPNLSFKGGFNTMRQYIHLISNTASISPMDTWKLSDADIAPTTGWQAAGGAYWTELGSGVDFSFEGYWKQMTNCLDYKTGAVLSMNKNLAQDLIPVYGRAWGVEAMVKKSTGKLTGWMSYSYSRSLFREMQDRGNATIAGGNWYNAPYDKPHEFKLVANWAFTHRYSISANVDYSTGRPVTVPVGMYYFSGMYRMAYSERNSYRIPDYFRMDAALNIDPGHYLKAAFHTTFTIGVYNITGRKNPYSVFFRTNNAGYVQGYMLSVFATQIPYVNVNILF